MEYPTGTVKRGISATFKTTPIRGDDAYILETQKKTCKIKASSMKNKSFWNLEEKGKAKSW